MIESLIKSLILTLIIELIVSILLGIRSKENIKVVVCANICTNPVVVYVSNCVYMLNNDILYFVVVAILELLAVFVEFILYKNFLNFDKISPLIISLVCNVISFGIGVIINNII